MCLSLMELLLALRAASKPSMFSCAGAKAGAGEEAAVRTAALPGMCLFLCEEVESMRKRQGAVCKAAVVTQLSKTLMGQ